MPRDKIGPRAKGVPTDDTAYKLYILHPWFEAINAGTANFTEKSFRDFIDGLQGTSTTPQWVAEVRDLQIDAWFEMYEAFEAGRGDIFFEPDVPIVFGMFMFLEIAPFRIKSDLVDNYQYFKNCTVLDQGYVKVASEF